MVTLMRTIQTSENMLELLTVVPTLLTLDQFLKLGNDISNSQLKAMVTRWFGSHKMPRKQELVVDRGQLVSLFAVHQRGVFLASWSVSASQTIT